MKEFKISPLFYLKSLKEKPVVLIFFLFLTMGLFLYSASVEQSVRKKCSGIVLKDVSGKSVKMSEYFGKELMIVFWSVNCSHCVDIIDVFKEIKEIAKFKLPYFNRYNFKKRKTEINFFHNTVDYFVSKNKIYMAVSYEDKELYEIFDRKGKLIKKMRIKREKREVLKREKEETLRMLKEHFKERIFSHFIYKFRKYYPSFAKIYINSGRIYLMEYPYIDFVRIRVRDMNGKLIGVKDIKIKDSMKNYAQIYMYNDTIYYLGDNENTEKWELKVIKLNLE